MSGNEVVVSLASFVQELGLAWQKLAMYQSGHPERKNALDRAHAVLVGLVAPTGSLSLGVGQDSLIGPEEKLSTGPASRLAAALYFLGVAVLRVEEGVQSWELEHLLNQLPRSEAQQEDRNLGAELQELGVRHITVEKVDFTGLLATDTLDGPGLKDDGKSLWDSILQRLLDDDRFRVDPTRFAETGGSRLKQVEQAVGQVLERYRSDHPPGEEAEDSEREDVISALSGLVGEAAGGELLEAGDEGGRRSAARHVTELLSAMPGGMQEGILDASVRELVSREEAAPGLRSLGSAVSAATMVGSLRRLRTDGVSFDPKVVSAVESLVAEGTKEITQEQRAQDPEKLASRLRSVFADEDVDRVPMTSGLQDRIFLQLRRSVPVHALFSDLSPYLDTITDQRLEVDFSMTLIDLLKRPFLDDNQTEWVITRQQETFKMMLSGGQFVAATRIVESLLEIIGSKREIASVREAAQRCLDGLRDSETLSGIVDVLGEVKSSDVGLVHRLIELLGPQAVHELLCVLGEEEELSRRRHIFDLLATLGEQVVAPSIGLLDDPRWYMARNILSLLRRVGHGLTPDVVQRELRHEDSRVRSEAVKCLPDLGQQVTADMVGLILADSDPKVAELGVTNLGSAGVRAAVQPLVDLLNRPDPLGRHRRLRLRALQALADIGDPEVLSRIGRFFRRWLSPVSSEEQQAAFKSLAKYPQEARAPLLKKGRFSVDPAVREICRSLESGEAAGKEE